MISFKFNYLYENESAYVAEIKLLNVDENALKKDIYHWVKINKVTDNLRILNPLHYQTSSNYSREFDEGQLLFNKDFSQVMFTNSKFKTSQYYRIQELNDIDSHNIMLLLTTIDRYFVSI